MIKYLTEFPDELTEVNIYRLRRLQVKAEAYLKPKRASLMKLFCANS